MPAPTSKELKATLWKAAEKLRGSLSAGQYKDVILGLVFLKHVLRATLEAVGGQRDIQSSRSARG
jgi:type I restriction enzyme M protein